MIPIKKPADLHFAYKAIIAGLSGALVTVALPPFGIWISAFAGLSLFYILLTTVTDTHPAFILSWMFGFGYFVAGLWWIANALLVEGNPFSWVWPLAVAGLPGLLAVFPAFAGALTVKTSNTKTLSGFLTFILFFSLFEWLRGHLFTGFPWNLYGYIWDAALPIAQLGALGGIYFLTLVTLIWACLPGWLLVSTNSRKTRIVVCSLAAMSALCAFTYGTIRLETSPQASEDRLAPVIKVVQPNILQEDKWNPDKTLDNLERLLAVSRPDKQLLQNKTAAPVILIWPETALTEAVLNHPGFRKKIAKTLSMYPQDLYLLSGLLRSETKGNAEKGGSRAYYNSLAAFDKNLNILGVYDKSHLVPFGEFIPFQEWVPLAPFVQLTGFTPGPESKTLDIGEIPPFRPLICYEIIFPSQAAATEGQNSLPAKWIVNVTNDAWYGDSPGPYQHFAQARFRAIEQGIPVIRAANTGISGVIDPYGRMISATPLFEARSLLVPLPLGATTNTVFNLYGNKLFLLIIISIVFGQIIFHYGNRKD